MEDSLEESPLRIAIHQPGYHKYLGYFYKMLKSDVFISLDTVQYVPREWQNRQVFYYDNTHRWLSVPVNSGRDLIKNKKIVNKKILKDHWELIKYIYRKTPFLKNYKREFENIYLQKNWIFLVDLCEELIILARDILNIKTKFVKDSQNKTPSLNLRKSDFLIDSIKRYVSLNRLTNTKINYIPRQGPLPKDFYLVKELYKFKENKIKVEPYTFHHPIYRQFQNPKEHPFVPNLSIFDLIFNYGDKSIEVLRHQT